MKCNICGNENDRLFVNNKCIKCLKYIKNKVIDDSYFVTSKIKGYYKLTFKQEKISNELIDRIEREDILINAVTGAGKTEMIYPLIERMVNDGKKLDLLHLEKI